jgi:hypothetical protein
MLLHKASSAKSWDFRFELKTVVWTAPAAIYGDKNIVETIETNKLDFGCLAGHKISFPFMQI